MERIDTAQKLEQAIGRIYPNHQAFLTALEKKGFKIPKSVLSQHVNGSKKLTEWHVIAYSFIIQDKRNGGDSWQALQQ